MSQYYERPKEYRQHDVHGRYAEEVPQYAARDERGREGWERGNQPRQYKTEQKVSHRGDELPQQTGNYRREQRHAPKLQYEEYEEHQHGYHQHQKRQRSHASQEQYGQQQQLVKNPRKQQAEPEMQRGGRRETFEQHDQYQVQENQDTSQSDMGDENDLDEGTIVAQGRQGKKRSNRRPQQERQPYAIGEYEQQESRSQHKQRHRSLQPMYDFDEQVGYQIPATHQQQPKRTSQHSSPMQGEGHQDHGEVDEEWEDVQRKIDVEYQKKLKEVNDEAMAKLSLYQQEHKEMIEKSQFIYNQKKPRSRVGSNASRGSLNTGPKLLHQGQRSDAGSRALNSSQLNRSRADSRASNLTNLSFLSSNQGGTSKSRQGRNRFFSPRQVNDLPPQTIEPEERVEERDETIMIKKFYKEYCAIVKKNVSSECQIYLVDVLEQLHFLDDEAVNDNRMKLCAMLREHKQNFMVYSKSGEYSGESEDIIKNLFKILCGIQHFKLKQRGHNGLDEKLLRTYCGAIRYSAEDPDFTVMDQLNTIKSLINRKAFSLSENQIGFLHSKFKNFHKQREEFRAAENKTKSGGQGARQQQITKEQQPHHEVQQQSRHFETPNPRYSQFEEQEERIRSQPMPQSQQQKAHRQEQQLLEEEEQYSYKPVKGQHNKTTVLYSDVIGNSRQEYSQNQKRTASNNKRPWSGARPASRTSRSSTGRGSRGSYNGQERSQYKQVNYNPRVQSREEVESYQYKPQHTSVELGSRHGQKPQPDVSEKEMITRQQAMNRSKDFVSQHKQPIQPQSLLYQEHIVEHRRGGRKHNTEQKSMRTERHESSLRRQREAETKRQAEHNAQMIAEGSKYPRQKPGKAAQNGQSLNQSAQDNLQSKAKYQQQPEGRGNNSFGNHNSGSPSHQHQAWQPAANFPPAVEEPICVLKIELDGEHVEEIKVFKNDEPFELVQQFGEQFNLSDNAKHRLFEQIQEQILAEESERE